MYLIRVLSFIQDFQCQGYECAGWLWEGEGGAGAGRLPAGGIRASQGTFSSSFYQIRMSASSNKFQFKYLNIMVNILTSFSLQNLIEIHVNFQVA